MSIEINDIEALHKKIKVLENSLLRARKARKQSEQILEEKSKELWQSNKQLSEVNNNLEYLIKDRTQKLEQANNELKDFAHVVSHDLKAPLRAIKSMAEWLIEDYAQLLDKEGREHLNLIQTRTQRMQSLINGLLEYAKVGQDLVKLQQVNMHKEMEDLILFLDPPKNIEVKITTELPTLWTDKIRINQVFQNLLSNAIKYNDKEKGLIEIFVEENEQTYVFSVKDNGPGIEEQYFNKIFKVFQTLEARDKFESTGVGLSIVQKIINLLNGKVWLTSTIGKGALFNIELPKKSTIYES